MPFFPSVLLRSEPVAAQSKAASRRMAAKTRPSRQGGRAPSKRLIGLRFTHIHLALRTVFGPWVSPLARFYNPAPEGKTGKSRISFGRLIKQDDNHDQNRNT